MLADRRGSAIFLAILALFVSARSGGLFVVNQGTSRSRGSARRRNASGPDHLRKLGRDRWSAGQDCVQPKVSEPHVAFENCCQDGAKIGGNREIAPLIELRRGEARPVAVNAAAIDRAP